MRRRIGEFAQDQSGATAVLAALLMLLAAGFGALAVDVGSFFYQKRRLQSAADLSALAAASDLANAQKAAVATLTRNGYDASTLKSVTFGNYAFDTAVPPAQRFAAAASGGNAVKVVLQTTAPIYLGRIFNLLAPRSAHAQTTTDSGASPIGGSGQISGDGSVVIVAKATAVPSALASFAIGSRLLQLDGGILNSVLGSLLGSSLSLTVMDYQSLANANIDLFAFSNALATRANLTAVTYTQLAQANIQTGAALNAIVDAARVAQMASGLIAALTEIANAATTQSQIDIAPLLSYGPYGNRQVGSPAPISASVSALDLVTAVLQIANGKHQIETALALNLPGIASASLQLAIGERPVGASFVAVGSTGASVHTAQTRLFLSVKLLASGQTSLVEVPIYIVLASGTAQLSGVQCSGADVTTSTVTLGVTPAVIDAWIGDVSNADFMNFTTAPNPGAATLLNVLGLAKVTGRAHATISNLAATPVAFTYSDIRAVTKKATSTADYTASLLSALVGDLQIQVKLIGLGLGLPSTLSQFVAQTIATATSPIDQLLANVLDSLGISLGQAVTWVSGVRCGTAVLVS
ncbi:MAG: hypothetical protein C3F11_18140 [Methylocystaceae bacterium]|nr:MAG: hypothetical protein C3F11_18140 [Methylocystaceae bacterium]